jgi:hypothetical protein
LLRLTRTSAALPAPDKPRWHTEDVLRAILIPPTRTGASVGDVLDHAMLRNLRAAAKLIAGAKETNVSDLADDEHTTVDEVLTQIIQDAIRIRSRLNKPTGE